MVLKVHSSMYNQNLFPTRTPKTDATAQPARQMTIELFFPVVIKLSRHTTRTFFSIRNKTFPPQQKNWHNRTTVLYTKYVRNTKNYILPKPKKLTQHHNCMVLQLHSSMYNQNLPISRQNQKLTRQHNWKNWFLQPTQSVGRFLQPTQSECICFSVRPSFCPWVRAKRGIE